MEMVPIDCQGSLRQRALDEYAVSLKLLDAVKIADEASGGVGAVDFDGAG